MDLQNDENPEEKIILDYFESNKDLNKTNENADDDEEQNKIDEINPNIDLNP